MDEPTKRGPSGARVALDALEVLGLLLVIAGVAAWSVPAALIVAGLAVVAVLEFRAWLGARQRASR